MKIIKLAFATLCASAIMAVGAHTDARAADKPIENVSFGMSSTTMLNLPIYVADVMGFFKKNGVNPDLVKFNKGGATALAAVISGNVNIYIGSTSSAIRAAQNGTDALIIGTVMSEVALNIVLDKRIADKLHITSGTPIKQRMAALKGTRIGVTGAGSATHQIVQYTLMSAGLDPTRDATIAFVGSGANMLGALASGNVDAIVAANPDSDIAIMQHHGVLLMNGTTGEYPGLKGMAQLVAVTTRRWAGKNPDLARRVLASIQDGQKAIHDPKQSQIARELVYKKYFNATDKAIFDIAWNHVTPAFPTSPKFSSDQVARNIKYLNTFSEKKYVIEPTQVYTEAYLP